MNSSRRFQPPPLVLPFAAVAWAEDTYCSEAEERLSDILGPLGERSQLYDFSAFSHYYDGELGGRVWKYLVAADRLVTADRLVELKLSTEAVETDFRRGIDHTGPRRVNLDPGYVNGWQVVLATVKNHGHRLYLGQGVFAEVTLRYVQGRFEALPWTYPDYQSPPVHEALYRFRQAYHRKAHRP